MAFLNDIRLWLSDHGIDPDPAETQAYFDFVNDDYLLAEFLDNVYAEIAIRWDGLEVYPFAPQNTLVQGVDGNMTFMMPVFRRLWVENPIDHKMYYEWQFVPNQVLDYYNSGSELYDLPDETFAGECQFQMNLPNLGTVLVVRRFVLPTLVDDMKSVGISCHVYEDEDEVTLIFEWNCREMVCPFDVPPLARLTVDEVVKICVPSWAVETNEVSIYDGDRMVLDIFDPQNSSFEDQRYYVYWNDSPREVPPMTMLKTYGEREIAEMYRADDDLERLIMLLA